MNNLRAIVLNNLQKNLYLTLFKQVIKTINIKIVKKEILNNVEKLN